MKKDTLNWRHAIDIWYVNAGYSAIEDLEMTEGQARNLRAGTRLAKAVMRATGETQELYIYPIMESLCAVIGEHTSSGKDILAIATALAEAEILEPTKLRHMEDFTEIKGIGPKYANVLEKIRDDFAVKKLTVRISYRAWKRLKHWADFMGMSMSMLVESIANGSTWEAERHA